MNLSTYREYQRQMHRGNIDQRYTPIRMLNEKQWLFAVCITLLGLLTFFVPLISTDPALNDIDRWSLWSMLWGIEHRSFITITNMNFIVILGSMYGLMLVDLIGLCFFRVFSVAKIQVTVSTIELWLCLVAGYSHIGQKSWHLNRFFYSRTDIGHVNPSPLVNWLLIIMIALSLVSLDAILDTGSYTTLRTQASRTHGASEVLSAESMEENDENKSRPDPPRLHE